MRCYMVFEHKVMAWSMAETVTVTLYGEKDGVVYQGQSITTSVEELALEKIASYESAGNATACTALVDMLTTLLLKIPPSMQPTLPAVPVLQLLLTASVCRLRLRFS